MLARNTIVKLTSSNSVVETKTTSKTSSLKALLLKAWRERWSDLQWGINIKTVLPRGVSGDVYDLADCILQQAVVGSGANQLVLSYLRHSLSTQLVSYAAVLQQISKYSHFAKPHCIASLLDFLESVQPGITCRAKPEENLLATSLINICLWLLNVLHYNLTNIEANSYLINQNDLLEKPCILLNNFIENEFTSSMLYLAKHENAHTYSEIQTKCQEVNTLLKLNLNTFKPPVPIESALTVLSNLEIDTIFSNDDKSEPITYCMQSLLAIQVFLNPCSDIKVFVAQLLMIKRIKGYSLPRLYCELIRACLMALSDVSGTRESQWGAFTFLKVPHILQQLVTLTKITEEKEEFSQDIVDAFELLLQHTPLLDITDIKCSCNCLECLLNELNKLNLVSEKYVKYFASKREGILNNLQKFDPNSVNRASIPKVIIRAEPTLAGILKMLSADYVKIQEALLSMLYQVLNGKSFELILAVATVQGKLKLFVSMLIKFNEYSIQPMANGGLPEAAKNAHTRAMLFDVSFLMLCSIVQTYGTKMVIEENGNSFFEQWVRACMSEPNNPKSPDHIVNLCDSGSVDALIKQLNSPDVPADFKYGQTNWHEVCINVPGAVKEVLCAWERGAIGAADVKRVLDALRGSAGGCCALAVCAAAWLCAHVRLVHQDAFLKPMNMVQQLLLANVSSTPTTTSAGTVASAQGTTVPGNNCGDDSQDQVSFKERSSLMSQIIRKFQSDINPPSAKNKGTITPTIPTVQQLKQLFLEIQSKGWISGELTSSLESLLLMGGPRWFVSNMIQEMLKLKYIEDLNKAADLIFAIFHLDIERCTLALLSQVLPTFIFNNSQSEMLVEPQSSTIARLCVYCIIATIEFHNYSSTIQSKKRLRREMETEESELSPASKLLRLNDSSSTEPNLALPNITPNSQANGNSQNGSENGSTQSNNGPAGNNATFPAGTGNIINSATNNASGLLNTSETKYGFNSRHIVEPSLCLKEPLSSTLRELFMDFLNVLDQDSHISYEIYFVFQFLKSCVLYGKDLASAILQNMPPNLVPSLLKCLPDQFTSELLLKLYDVSVSNEPYLLNSNKSYLARDLCMLRNIFLKKQAAKHNK